MTPEDFLTLLKNPAVAAEMAALPWRFKAADQDLKSAHALVLTQLVDQVDALSKAVTAALAAFGKASATPPA